MSYSQNSLLRFGAVLLIVSAAWQVGSQGESAAQQPTELAPSQRTTLQRIVGADRDRRGSKKIAGIGVLFAGAGPAEISSATKLMAKDSGRELYRVDSRSIVSKYIGETEKNVRQVFAAARASNAIIFFDEADALFGKRSEVRDSHDRYANMEINYLLQQIETYDGIVIISTKRKETIDEAFRRRLRFIVEFQPPGKT